MLKPTVKVRKPVIDMWHTCYENILRLLYNQNSEIHKHHVLAFSLNTTESNANSMKKKTGGLKAASLP